MAIEIVCETHSVTEDNERGIATGWQRGRLSPRGRELAAELGRRRGGDRLAARVLSRMTIIPIDKQEGRAAGELLGRTGLSGHRCALAAVALAQPRPAVLLTSDADDMRRLTEEPGRRRAERIEVVRV